MKYDQGMYHGGTWLEAFVRFRIADSLQRLFKSKKTTETQQA